MQVRLDGKAIRGAKDADGNQVRLLAALAGPARRLLGGRRAGRGRQEDERGADGPGGPRPDRPGRQDRDCGRAAHGEGHRELHPRARRRVRAPGEGKPAGHCSTPSTRCHGTRSRSLIPPPIKATAGSPPAPSRSCPPPRICRSRTSARCSSSNGTSPACTASRSRPSPRSASPARNPGRQTLPTWPGLRPGTMVDRVFALAPRHPLSRGQIPGQNPIRAQGHGFPAEPRNRRTPPGRTHRRHRSHPMGRTLHGPPIHHPRTHIMILERPCQAADRRKPRSAGQGGGVHIPGGSRRQCLRGPGRVPRRARRRRAAVRDGPQAPPRDLGLRR